MNEGIRAREVRLISVAGEQLGVVPADRALAMARDQELDLVEVAHNSQPPVCRIMDYSKFKYEQSKKERKARKKQRFVHVKEVKFRPRIESNDYRIKLDRLKQFLSDGSNCKVTLMFRGREMVHQELGHRLLARIERDLADVAVVERAPLQEGRMINMVFHPK